MKTTELLSGSLCRNSGVAFRGAGVVVVDVEGVVEVEVEVVSEVWIKTVVSGEEVELGLTACVLVAELTMMKGASVTSFPSLLTDSTIPERREIYFLLTPEPQHYLR